MKKMIAIFIFSVLLMASCTSEEEATKDITVLETTIVAKINMTSTANAPTATPEPTNTPLPTDTPAPTDTPTPTDTPAHTNTPELDFVAGDTQVSEKDGMTLVYVPAGEFQMGSDAEEGLTACQELYEPFGEHECERDWFENEEPVHPVYTDAFWMDQTEVTNAQYQQCVDKGDCAPPETTVFYAVNEYYGHPQYDEYPVIYVSWNDAQTYCEWAGRRLPTETEWEKAARGEAGLTYPWGNNFNGNRLNFCDSDCEYDWANPNYDDGFADTAPVGNYSEGASHYGVLDMAGNVREWVADWYDSDYYANSPFENPEGPSSGDLRVWRGGSWLDNGNYVRAAFRDWGPPDVSYNYLGFRCVRSAASP